MSAYELAMKWTSPEYMKYLDIATNSMDDVNEVFKQKVPFKARTYDGVFEVHPPVYGIVDLRIQELKDIVQTDRNKCYANMMSKERSSKVSATLSSAALELVNLLLYKEIVKSAKETKVTGKIRSATQELKAARRQLSDNDNLDNSKRTKVIAQVVDLIRKLDKYLDQRDGLSAVDLYIRELPDVILLKEEKRPDEKKAKKPVSRASSSRSLASSMSPSSSGSPEEPKPKAKRRTREDDEDRNERVKERVLPMMSPFKIIRKKFSTEEQCKTTKRSKEYFVSKKDLVAMIKSKKRLAEQFTGLEKMSKDDICEKLFKVSDKFIKI